MAAGKHFMAGGDISVFHNARENAPQEAGRLIELFHQIVRRIRRMAPPLICGVQGAVAGGGLGTVSGQDCRARRHGDPAVRDLTASPLRRLGDPPWRSRPP